MIFHLVIVGVFLLLNSCKKDKDKGNEPVIPIVQVPVAVFNPNLSYGTVTDIDGNVYKTITIGTQTWMAENLRSTKYNDGTTIQKITSNTDWKNLSTAAYCTYNNTTRVDSISVYGCLYNWYAVNTGKLSPSGWHIPSKAEWQTLIDYLGGLDIAGGKMKEISLLHWSSPNTSATNESGFTGLPAGERYGDVGTFVHLNYNACYWSTTAEGVATAWGRNLSNIAGSSLQDGDSQNNGWSIRCIKD